jgi:hypothetical protein
MNKRQVMDKMHISPSTYNRFLRESLQGVKEIPLSPDEAAQRTLEELLTIYRNSIIQFHNSKRGREQVRLLRFQSRLAFDILRQRLRIFGGLSKFDEELAEPSKQLPLPFPNAW